jgi:agmatine deiminase
MTPPPLPEWAPHKAVWIGFPSDPDLWLSDLKAAEREVAAFAKAVHAGGKGEQVWLVAAHEDAAAKARELAPFAKVIVEKFGDIWLRDSGPIVMGSGKQRRAQGFGFNGWGGKYDLEGDQDIGERLAKEATLSYAKAGWVLEGGAIDHDGSGTVITTEQRRQSGPVRGAGPRGHPDLGKGRPERCGLPRCGQAAEGGEARHRHSPLAGPHRK